MVAQMVTDWVEHEVQEVDLGDKRLSYRLKLCVSQAARIGESTPDRARSKADLKATYRLVDNPKVSMDEILSQHNQSTRQRCSAYKRIYLIQDTTEVDLTKPRQRVEGAGPLGTDKRQGFRLRIHGTRPKAPLSFIRPTGGDELVEAEVRKHSGE